MRLWNGTTVSLSDLPPVGTVTIKDRATLWRLIIQPDLAFGESAADPGDNGSAGHSAASPANA